MVAPVRSVVEEKRSAVDLVAAEVRRAILTGELSPGASFAVTDLTGPLGVSHIPVREALRRLEAQGLVIFSAAKRPRVAPLALDDLESVFDLRARLEPELFRRSVVARTDEWLDTVEKSWTATFAGSTDADDIRRNHAVLEEDLVRPARSVWDKRLLDQLWDAAQRYTNLVFHPDDIRDEAEMARRGDVYRGMLDAARRGDADNAALALRDHLDASLVRIRSVAATALMI